jgi:hypothetical protein
VVGGAPREGGLAGDLGERRGPTAGGGRFDDPQPALEGLVGLGAPAVHGNIPLFQKVRQYGECYLIYLNRSTVENALDIRREEE